MRDHFSRCRGWGTAANLPVGIKARNLSAAGDRKRERQAGK
jgi:hypothetical protein